MAIGWGVAAKEKPKLVDKAMASSVGFSPTEVIGVETGSLVKSDSTLRDASLLPGINNAASLTKVLRSGLDVSSNIV